MDWPVIDYGQSLTDQCTYSMSHCSLVINYVTLLPKLLIHHASESPLPSIRIRIVPSNNLIAMIVANDGIPTKNTEKDFNFRPSRASQDLECGWQLLSITSTVPRSLIRPLGCLPGRLSLTCELNR